MTYPQRNKAIKRLLKAQRIAFSAVTRIAHYDRSVVYVVVPDSPAMTEFQQHVLNAVVIARGLATRLVFVPQSEAWFV